MEGSNSSGTSGENTTFRDNVEYYVCQTKDLEENEMRLFTVATNQEILLVRQNGKFMALSSKCTHYGANLINGVLGKGFIRCPWHNACFNLNTGDIEDFPGLDSLYSYRVAIFYDEVHVFINKSEQFLTRREKEFVYKRISNSLTYVVVGGGPAGVTCLQFLRQNGFSGRLFLIAGEPFLPYDRTKLSKILSIRHKDIILKKREFYKKRQIEVRIGLSLDRLMPSTKQLALSNGELIRYDKVFLATGSRALEFDVPGANLTNIFTLHNYADTRAIFKVIAPTSKVVILGSSYVGLEVASAMAPYTQDVSIVDHAQFPLPRMGKAIGNRIKRLFEEKGIKFFFNDTIREFKGSNQAVTSVLLESGTEIDATLCVLAIGVRCNTDYIKDTGAVIHKDGSIEVNDCLETSISDVYAGGDVAYAPVYGFKASIRSLQLAHFHGKIAALNMTGSTVKIHAVPFFWFFIFGKSFRFCGFPLNFSDIEIRGDLDDLNFIAFYIMNNQQVGAVLTVGRDPIAGHFGNMLKRGVTLSAAKIDHWLENI